MPLTFAYGSNLSREQMSVRCPSGNVIGVGTLRDHRLTFNRYSSGWTGGVADVVPSPGDEVWGIVWELSDRDFASLDAYEDVPDGYRRSELEIGLREGGVRLAWVYTVVRKSPFTAPSREYLEIIRDAARELDFPPSYRNALDRVPRTRR
jgi:gamma-glutamylcyclotransferase (GGCT)/AIG2-like uncharacterized protein YtfP